MDTLATSGGAIPPEAAMSDDHGRVFPAEENDKPRRVTRLDRLTEERAATRANRLRGDWLWGLTRVTLGFIFLWTFLDQLFGLGLPTPRAKSWLAGGSPTRGYLTHVNGPFADLFHRMAGQAWADWLYMLGMAGLGVALILGIGMVVAAVTGPMLLLMLWLSTLPIASNPFVDQHVIYALVIVSLAVSRVGERFGLGAWWSRTRLVRALPFLR
jgi:thiosulfate dehydrogenase [quinone] large subunit